MEYDPTEMFRVDPGEMELSPELQAEMELERQAEEAEVAQAAQAEAGMTTPTGGQPEQPQQPAPATAEQEQQFPWEPGYDLGDYARQTAESAFAAQTGMLDFGVDVINKVSGQSFPKLKQFETEHLQALREISSVVLPTLGLSRLGMAGGAAAQTRVGWSLGNNAFVKWAGTLGVESLAGS